MPTSTETRPLLPAPHRHDPRDWSRVYCDTNGRSDNRAHLFSDGTAYCGKCAARSTNPKGN